MEVESVYEDGEEEGLFVRVDGGLGVFHLNVDEGGKR